MATIRLIPSAYTLSSTSYLSISNASNMYTNTDSTTYATVNHTRNNSTSAYYLYIHGFNFSLPSNAVVSSFTVKIKASETGLTTTGSYRVSLYNNTTAISNTTASTSIGTGVATITIPTDSLEWSTIAGYGNNFRIRVPLKRSSQNTAGSVKIYGAEIEVNYTIPVYHQITTVSNTDLVDSIDPEGTTSVVEGDDFTFNIYTNDINDILVDDNGVDVTSQLTYESASTSQTFTGIPTSYDSSRSSYDSLYEGSPSDGLAGHTSSSRVCAYVARTANAEANLVYNFDCSSIPNNATITSVTCIAGAACYSNGQYFNTRTVQLYNGTTPKGTAVTITGTGNTNTAHNINGGSWTREELNNIQIVVHIQRGNSTTQASFSFWGATLSVEYTLPSSHYYKYELNNVTSAHSIVVKEYAYIPPEEDPTKTYYNLTISSINATTEPSKGTTRVESGTNNTITIYPSDPLVTLVTDNGVDVSNQLVAHGGTIQNPTVTTASGASYGFNLNSSTGYYVSQNTGVDKSAAVCVVNFDLPVRCLVTINYINYAEATYDFGIFGNIDVPLTNDYKTASGSMPDSNYKLACNTSTYNTSSVQTITYEIPSGEHQVYIKYTKDDATSSNNDTLQWKIASIEPLETNNYYTYTLSNISQDHSLIFIFGNVSYYFVNSSTSGGCILNPNGQMVQLPGDSYRLVIVPNNVSDTITITDNNVNVTSSLERKDITIEKEGVQTTVVNYIYILNNIQATHNLYVTTNSQGLVQYIRNSSQWKQGQMMKKQNSSWGGLTYTRIWVHNGNSWVENAQRTITAKGVVFGGTINNR